jgi:excinuclease ABC subunit C
MAAIQGALNQGAPAETGSIASAAAAAAADASDSEVRCGGFPAVPWGSAVEACVAEPEPETQATALADKARQLPPEPGVYLFKDARGKVLYVGKAKVLRDRIRSYLGTGADVPPKTRALMSRAQDLDWIVARNEVEALILECNLIKEYRPRYNIRLRDDKKFPYVRITTDPFPRVFATRTLVHDGSEYFGPYSDVGAMRRTLALLQRLLPTRPCTPPSLDGIDRPCLYYDIKMCGAPCVGLQSRQDYLETVDGVRLFLRGRTDELVTRLKTRMQERAEQRQYEAAARVRDQIRSIERVTDRMRAVVGEGVERDAMALRRDGANACGVVLEVRGGRLLATETFYFADRDESDQEVFTAFFEQYYNSTTSIPQQILVGSPLDDPDLLTRWLSEKRGAAVEIAEPQRGEKRTLVDLALKNATLKLDEWLIAHGVTAKRVPDEVVQLGAALGMRELPRAIECFDISNFQGAQPVASLVRFEAGQPSKKHYKHFRIRGLVAPNDFAMMEHVVERHFRTRRDDAARLPELVLVDGGRGQLAAAERALERLGLAGRVTLVGLAKRQEEIFRSGHAEPLVLPRTSPALKLVQRVRDEAHRFAVSYHRRLRDRELVHSALDDIPGVGVKTRIALLRRFGSVAGVAAASAAELASVAGVGPVTAERILSVLAHPALRPRMAAALEPDPAGTPAAGDDIEAAAVEADVADEVVLDAEWLDEAGEASATDGDEGRT